MDTNMQTIWNDKYRGGRIPRRLEIVPSKYTLMYVKKYFVAINIHILIYTHTHTLSRLQLKCDGIR
jgi:hypothetical protein